MELFWIGIAVVGVVTPHGTTARLEGLGTTSPRLRSIRRPWRCLLASWSGRRKVADTSMGHHGPKASGPLIEGQDPHLAQLESG